MDKQSLNPFWVFQSDNRQSKIQNPKWVGFLALVVAFVGLAGVARAQPKKVARIGYISTGYAANEFIQAEAFRQALRERGYIEGEHIAFEHRYGEGKQERFPDILAELVRLKVDIIVAA